MGTPKDLWDPTRLEGEGCGIPHLAKNERDAPNFLYAALDRAACAPLFKERRMKCREPHETPQEIGGVGHPAMGAGIEPKSVLYDAPKLSEQVLTDLL
jgi:hypothetical protein